MITCNLSCQNNYDIKNIYFSFVSIFEVRYLIDIKKTEITKSACTLLKGLLIFI